MLISTMLHAQYDEKRIQLNQAMSFENLNQFTRAQGVYIELLKKMPNDQEVIQRLVSNYIRSSSIDKADQLLEEKKEVLTPFIYTQNKISVYILKNEIDQAKTLADQFIKINPLLINNYQLMASSFEINNLHEIASSYYLQARKISNNPTIFAFELSNNYFQLQNYKSCIDESVRHLSLNPSYLYYVSTRFKQMVKSDSLLITDVKNICQNSDVEEVRELLAISYLELNQFDQALMIYQTLKSDKLLRFADELYSKEMYAQALSAYQVLTQKAENTIMSADVKMKIANLYFKQKKLLEAKQILTSLIESSELNNRNNLYKTKSHRESRELYAEILIMENADKNEVLKYFKMAEDFCFNDMDKKNIEFKRINYYIMKKEFPIASQSIERISKNEEAGSAILAQSYYYLYLLSLMQKDQRADSLMTEYIIYFPENPVINDMLFMSLFLTSIPKDAIDDFFEAYRLKNLYQDKEAINTLSALLEKTQDDEISLLLADWMKNDFQFEKAKEIYSRTYKNPVYQEFAKLELIRLSEDELQKKQTISDYLKTSPNSVFSPVFRQLLFKQSLKT